MKSITHGKYSDIALDRELRDIILAIKELQNGGLLTTSNASAIVVSSSGSSSSSTVEIRKGIAAVTGGTTQTILFATAMPSAGYSLPQCRCYSTIDGLYTDVGFTISNKTIYGFDITPNADATCEYAAFY